MLVKEITYNDADDFFEKWVEWLRPVHHLTTQEMHVFAAILRYRNELSISVSDKNMLEEMTTNRQGRRKLRKSLGMKSQQMCGVMARIAQAKIVIPSRDENGNVDYYRINPSAIPDIDFDKKDDFKMLLTFKKDDDARQ